MTDAERRVCFPYVGDDVGGSHLSSIALVRGLAGSGYVPVVVVHARGRLTDELDRQGVVWELAPGTAARSTSRTAQAAAVVRSLAPAIRFLRDRDVSIVHTNDARMHRTWGPAARMAGRRHVWHQRNAGLSWKMAQVARLANEIVTVSHFTRSTLPPHLARRARVIDNPFDTDPPGVRRDRARSRLSAEVQGSEAVPVVGFAGALIDRKRPLLFVDMALQMIRDGSRARFVMFGADDGPLAGAVRDRIVEHGARHQILHLGFRSPIEEWLAACDVLVLPSVSEPFARTVVEAMIVGTPVVAVRDAGNLEIIESGVNGVLVAPEDPSELSRAVQELVDDPAAAARLAEAARRDVVRRFSIRRHVDAMLEVYSDSMTGQHT